MARVNITIPDDLTAEAKAAGINISEVTRRALADELARRARDAEFEATMAELEIDVGVPTAAEVAEAEAWAEGIFGPRTR